MVSKSSDSGLGNLKSKSRKTFKPSDTDGGQSSALDGVKVAIESTSKHEINAMASNIATVIGSIGDVAALISDDENVTIQETLQNTDITTSSIFEILGSITDAKHILGIKIPDNYFSDLHAMSAQVTKALDTVSTGSYASSVLSHLINIQSGVYATAAAFWGWEKVKKDKEIDVNLKTRNKDMFGPLVDTAEMQKEMMEKAKSSSSSSESVKLSAFEKGVGQQLDSIINILNTKNGSDVSTLESKLTDISSNVKDVSSLLKDIINKGDDIKLNLVGNKNEVLEVYTSSGKTQINATESTKNMISDAMGVIDQLIRLAEESDGRFSSGAARAKKLKKSFDSYKESIKYIITSINDIYKDIDVKEVKDSNGVDKMLTTFSNTINLINRFSDDNIDDLYDNIKYAKWIIGTPIGTPKGNVSVKDTSVCGFINHLSVVIRWMEQTLNDIKVDKTKKALSDVGSVFNSFNNITEQLSLKSLLSLYIKTSSLSRLVVPELNLLSKHLQDADGTLFENFGAKTAPQLQKFFDSLNIVGKSVNLKTGLKLSVGVKQYSNLAKSLIKMAADIEERLSDVDESELDKIVGKNGKLVKIGKLGRSINDINSAFKKAALGGVLARIGAKQSKKTIESINSIVSILGDQKFTKNLEASVGSKDSTVEKVKTLSSLLYDILKTGSKLALVGLPAKIGFALTNSAMKSYNKLLDTINEKDSKEIHVALDHIECMSLIVDELSKIEKTGSKLLVSSIPALLGFSLSIKTIEKLDELVTRLGTNSEDTLIQALDNAQSEIAISKEILKLTYIGSALAITSVPALVGFSLAHLAVKSGLKPLLSSIYKMFEKVDAKEYMFRLHALASISTSLLKICFAGTMLILFAPLAMVGFKLAYIAIKSGLASTLKAISKIVGKSGSKDQIEKIKQIEGVVKSLKDMCVAGAMLLLFAPLAMAGFMMLIPVVMVLASVLMVIRVVIGTEKFGAMATAKDLGRLIITLAITMVLGGLLGGVVMKMMPNIIMFTFALSFFIFGIVTALSLATIFGGGLRHLEKSAKAIQRLVIMSAMVMLIGGLIVMLQPKLIAYAFVFTILLGMFLFATVGIISLAARLAKHCVKELIFLMAFEIVTTLCLLVPACIMMQNPGLSGYIFLYLLAAGILVGGIAALAFILGKKSRTFYKAIPVMYAISTLMVAMGLTMVALAYATKVAMEAGGIDKLAYTGLTGLAMVAAIGIGVVLLGKVEKITLLVGLGVMAGIELLVLGLVKILDMLADVTNKITNFGRLWATIGSGFGILLAVTTAVIGLGAAASTGVGAILFAAGGAVMAELELLSYGLAKTLIAMSEASKVSINKKNILGLLDTMVEVQQAMLETGLDSIGAAFKMARVSAAIGTMGIAISEIAEGVADASNLHYSKYENGKYVGEFNLSDEDFSRAASNTKTVVSVLGNAILDIYDENPEIFSTTGSTGNFITKTLGDIAGIFGAQTKFGKVCQSVGLLGKVISKIAKGVADMANLHFTKYENGKELGEFNIGQTEFKAAAENTKLVIKTLGQAVMDAYNQNPEIFSTTGSTGNFITNTLGDIAGFFGADTKFGKVAKSMMALGNLISSLSKGVGDMANLVVTEYDKDGKEKKRNMNQSDFIMAAVNTDFIVTWLANTIVKVYESHPDLFTSGSGVGDTLGFNPKFKNIVDTVSALGGLMSNIAGGIQAMANNSMPVYGKNGEIIRKDPIKPAWYGQAATTIANVITTMGTAIMKVYDDHKDWFSAKWWTFGGTSDNNAFSDVMKSCTGMAEMVSKYVEIINQYANGKIDLYGPGGQVIGSVPIGKSTYTDAADAITSCISTMATAIYNTWNEHKGDIFDEDNFQPLMDNLGAMSELLGKYSEKVKEYANLTYDVYDNNGKVIGKHSIGEPEFAGAARAVKSIITTLVGGVWEAYNGKGNGVSYAKLFEDTNADTNKKGSGETWFGRIINSFLSVGPLISSMAKAVKEYATLQVPEYDPTTHVATGRMVQMTDATFKQAGESVKAILSSMVCAVGELWADQNNQTLFTNASSWGSGQKDNSNPFYIISTALNAAARMVNDSAVATKNVLSIPGFEKPQDIQDKLNTRIPVMTTALINAVVEAYQKGQRDGYNIFDDALSDNSPFKKVAVAMQSAYDVVDKSSKVYDNIGKMDMSQLEKVTGTSGDISSNKIYRMIKGLAEPIIDIYLSSTKGANGQQIQYKDLFYQPLAANSYFTRIKDGVEAVAKTMGNIKTAYDQISGADYNIGDVAKKIHDAILGLINPIGEAYRANPEAFDDAAPIAAAFVSALSAANPLSFVAKYFIDSGKPADTPAQRVIQALSGISSTMDGIANAYGYIANIPFKGQETKKKMTGMIKGLVEVFKDKELTDGVSEAKSTAKKLISFVKKMSEVFFGDMEDGEFGGILSVYEKLQNLKIGSQAIANNMALRLKRLVEGIVNAVNVPLDFDVMAAQSSFITMQRAVDTLINIYKTPVDMLQPIMSSYGATDVDTLIKNASEIIKSIPTKLGEVMQNGGMLGDKEKMDAFTAGAWKMKLGIGNLASAVEAIPMNKDISYFINNINSLNKEISSIPKLDEFVKETNNLVRFNSSVNSLQVKNVEMLTKLFIEFNKFSSKFGSLDKFTQVLATKMAQCLTYLADQIRASAKTIDKADEMQKKRQEQIRKTIEEFRKLADQGLEVTVKAAETEAGSGGFDTSSGDTGSSTSSTGSTTKVESQSYGSGSSGSNQATLLKIAADVSTIARKI